MLLNIFYCLNIARTFEKIAFELVVNLYLTEITYNDENSNSYRYILNLIRLYFSNLVCRYLGALELKGYT